jgi:hypothetical protein
LVGDFGKELFFLSHSTAVPPLFSGVDRAVIYSVTSEALLTDFRSKLAVELELVFA